MHHIIRDIRWIYYVSRRFSRVDNRGRFAAASIMPVLGIAFGVMALVVIIAVMNGFQSGSTDSILEISSYHARVVPPPHMEEPEVIRTVQSVPQVISVTPFYEAQGLLVGRYASQGAALIRAVPAGIMENDAGFARETNMYSGSFDLSAAGNIVLGYDLAANLQVRPGDTVNILALSGGSDVDLFSDGRMFTVAGVFYCGYGDINSAYAFIPLEAGKNMFGASAEAVYGIKIADPHKDSRAVSQLSALLPGASVESWRSFNRTFFGALRVEKNILMMLVFLIFLVVAVNIFNGMRRMVYERREEICVLSALGGSPAAVQGIFILQGFLIGAAGAIPGLVAGLLLTVRIDAVFTLFSSALYYVQLFFTMLFSPETAGNVRQNMLYLFYAKIPAHAYFSETLYITLFGMFAALAAAWFASRKTLNLVIAEVLRDE